MHNTAVGYPYTVKVYCCDWWSKKLGRRYSGQRKEEEVEPRCAGSHQETQRQKVQDGREVTPHTGHRLI